MDQRGSGLTSGSTLLSFENDGGAGTSVGSTSGRVRSLPCSAGSVGGTERANSESVTSGLGHGARPCSETAVSRR